jgi:hypothetical protein
MLNPHWLYSLVLAPLSVAALSGCETLGLDGENDTYDRDRTTYRTDRYDYDRRDEGWTARQYPNRNDRYDDRRDYDRRDYDRGNERLGIDDQRGPGGAAVGAGVPRDAGLVRTESDANGTVLSYRAPHPGRLYVFDRRSQRVIWSGNLRDGDAFSYSVVDNRGAINGRNIFDSRGGDRSTDVVFYFDVRR